MKRLLIVLSCLALMVSCGAGGQKEGKSAGTSTKVAKASDVVEVLSFHTKKRCVTCLAIENLTKEVVEGLKDSKVVLKVIDISDKANSEIADKYEATWSALHLDNGATKSDLTKMAFANARNNPDKFKELLLAEINKLKSGKATTASKKEAVSDCG